MKGQLATDRTLEAVRYEVRNVAKGLGLRCSLWFEGSVVGEVSNGSKQVESDEIPKPEPRARAGAKS